MVPIWHTSSPAMAYKFVRIHFCMVIISDQLPLYYVCIMLCIISHCVSSVLLASSSWIVCNVVMFGTAKKVQSVSAYEHHYSCCAWLL